MDFLISVSSITQCNLQALSNMHMIQTCKENILKAVIFLLCFVTDNVVVKVLQSNLGQYFKQFLSCGLGSAVLPGRSISCFPLRIQCRTVLVMKLNNASDDIHFIASIFRSGGHFLVFALGKHIFILKCIQFVG